MAHRRRPTAGGMQGAPGRVRTTTWSRRWLVAAAIGVLSLAGAGPAHATNWYGTNQPLDVCKGRMTDNVNVYVWYEGLASATITAMNATRNTDYNPTILNTYNEDVLVSQTDSVVYDSDYSSQVCNLDWYETPGDGGLIGYVRCMVVVAPSYRCDQHRIDFDLDFMGPESATAEESLACHEFGHAIGLAHIASTVNDSCMRSPLLPAENQLSGHDIAHFNANFP